jgi:phosphatidylserine synthase
MNKQKTPEQLQSREQARQLLQEANERLRAQPSDVKPVSYKTGVTYYIFLAVLFASFFYSEIFLPGMVIIFLVSAFSTFRIIRNFKTHGISIFFKSSEKELLEYDRHIDSSDYRSKYKTSIYETKWFYGFNLPFTLVLTSFLLIVLHILSITHLWLLLICGWPLCVLLGLALEGAAERIIPKP